MRMVLDEQITFSDVIAEMARLRGLSEAAILHQALSHEWYFFNAWQRGARIILEERDGKKIEVLPFLGDARE